MGTVFEKRLGSYDRRLEAGELLSIGDRRRAARNGRDLETEIGEGSLVYRL